MNARGQSKDRVPTSAGNTNGRTGGPGGPAPGDNRQQQQRPQTRFGWIWWVLLVIAVLWNIWLFWPSGAPSVSIPYSSLLAQVRAGNVKEVSITGDQISGTFSQPVTAPQVNPTITPTDATQQAQLSQTTYATFQTVFPQAVGDPVLMPLLQEHNVTVNVSEPSTPWFITLLSNGLPFLFLIGILFFAGRQAAQAQSGVFNFGRTRARRYSEDHPTTTFADVAGADEAKQDLA